MLGGKIAVVMQAQGGEFAMSDQELMGYIYIGFTIPIAI